MLSDEVKLFVRPWNRPPFGGLPSGAELSQLANGDEDSIFKWSPATSWLWNLHHQLARVGKKTALVERIPDRGVVLICGQDMPLWFRPPKKLLLVSIAADSPLRMFADVHVVQNPMQAERFTSSFRDPACVFIPHFPQFGLIPRDPLRGDRFERVAFLGARPQLEEKLRSREFAQAVEEIGLTFEIRRERFQHHDYSAIDAVLAVRSFDESNLYVHKPATKLVNAWHAGVPAILGRESAYREAGDPGQNYLEVSSINDVLTALRCLKNDVVLRRRLVGNGRRQYRAYSEEAVTQVWTRFLDNDLPVISERIRGGGFAYRSMYRQDQILRRIGASLQQRLLPHNSRK